MFWNVGTLFEQENILLFVFLVFVFSWVRGEGVGEWGGSEYYQVRKYEVEAPCEDLM